MKIKAAEERHIDFIVALRKRAAEWLDEIGSDQWSDSGLTEESFRQRVSDSIARRETWLACTTAGKEVGTIAVDHVSDPGLWTSDEIRSATFLHRMILDRAHAGQGVGRTLLSWAETVAVVHGKRWLRLDAWSTNEGLHRYYRSSGFAYVRTVQNRPSGALFQRPVPALISV